MSLTPLDYVASDLFPRDVRDTVNDLVERDTRPWEVKAAEDNSITSARFEFSDDRVVLILPRGAFGLGATACPFKITATTTGASVKISVSPGTANQYIATNVFATFTVSKTGTFYVKASIVTDGQNITSFSITCNGTEPNYQSATPSSLPTAFDVLLAIITNGIPYRTLGCGSIVATPAEAFRTDKPSPADPGELTYIPYYIWEISVA